MQLLHYTFHYIPLKLEGLLTFILEAGIEDEDDDDHQYETDNDDDDDCPDRKWPGRRSLKYERDNFTPKGPFHKTCTQ